MPPGMNVYMNEENSDDEKARHRPVSIAEHGLDLNEDDFNYDNQNNKAHTGFNNPDYYQQ